MIDNTSWSMVMFLVLSNSPLFCRMISQIDIPYGNLFERIMYIVWVNDKYPSSFGRGLTYTGMFHFGMYRTNRSLRTDSNTPTVTMSVRSLISALVLSRIVPPSLTFDSSSPRCMNEFFGTNLLFG